MILRWGIVALLILSLTGIAYGQRSHRLNVGDSSPRLSIEKWMLGDEVAELEKGKVYIVEFWATWCVPCRRAIPFLSHLQDAYGDYGFEIIGISNEKEEDVRRFLQSNPGLISYKIALDRDDNTGRAWMHASGQQGIPSSFIVDREGKIQYIGHPQGDHIETILRLVLQGRYDKKLFDKVASAVTAYEDARKVRNWRLATTHLDQVIDQNSHVFAMFNIDKFEMLLVDMSDADGAYGFARGLLEKYSNDAHFLVTLAEHIATDPKIDNEKRDLDLAMKAAKAAQQAGQPNDPAIMATLALVHFHQGDVEEAIRLQRRAWMIASPVHKATYERALRNYQESRQRAARMQAN